MSAISRTLKNDGDLIHIQAGFVLAWWEGQFVTWAIDKEGNCYWGHYHKEDQFFEAVQDFRTRVDDAGGL